MVILYSNENNPRTASPLDPLGCLARLAKTRLLPLHLTGIGRDDTGWRSMLATCSTQYMDADRHTFP